MTRGFGRRSLLRQAFAYAAASALAPRALLAADPAPTPPSAPPAEAAEPPFSAEWLRNHARELAAAPYQPVPKPEAPVLAELGWDKYQDIRFREEQELWHGSDLAFRIRFFHLGLFYERPVRVFEVIDGRVVPIGFSKEMFDYGGNTFDPPLPDDLGFAGFRLNFHTDFERDMASFLGASYFRAVGGEKQYGISARGLAIDTALPSGEEFPSWTTFWIERPSTDDFALTVHALLDSPSTTGAYRFIVQPGRTTEMNVEAALYPRRPIQRLGLAPLTSMYQHGENDQRMANDFRPEVHDSDGLAILRGNGERLWRPLVNPLDIRVNSYADENPRGFGLLQRDRAFDNYQDDGTYYDRRPHLWVEPRGQWGRGAVQLIEIPTNEEIFDNIVAFWTPEKPPGPGEEYRFAYRLFWGNAVPDRTWPVARVISTRTGIGGIPGQKEGRDTRKFVIDFTGGPLQLLTEDTPVEVVITASRGEIVKPAVRPIEELGGWRANFDLSWTGREPINLRCYLRLGRDALSETWIYQWTPPA